MKFHWAVIDIGDILHVHLMKGDWVVMNRQPSLHRLSMMGFRVVPQDVKTFKVSLVVTKPLNANFHRDEMNCHVPQNPMAATEVKELMATPLHILSPKNGIPIICFVQDAMVSMYLLTRRKKQIERLLLMQYLVGLDSLKRFNEIIPKLGFFFLVTKAVVAPNSWLLDGIIDKSSLGSSGLSLIKCILAIMGHRGSHNSLTSVNFWQIGTCCILDIVSVLMTVW